MATDEVFNSDFREESIRFKHKTYKGVFIFYLRKVLQLEF